MYKPCHPGEIIKLDVLPYFKISTEQTASILKIDENFLQKVLDGKENIDLCLANKLEEWIGVSSESWLSLQQQYNESLKNEIQY